MNPQNGKGSSPRKGAQDDKFKDNWDRIFGKKDNNPSKDSKEGK